MGCIPIRQNTRQQKKPSKSQGVRRDHPLQIPTIHIKLFLDRRQGDIGTGHEHIIQELRATGNQHHHRTSPRRQLAHIGILGGRRSQVFGTPGQLHRLRHLRGRRVPRSRSGTTQSGRGRFGDAGRGVGGTSGDLDVYWGLHLALILVRKGQEKSGECSFQEPERFFIAVWACLCFRRWRSSRSTIRTKNSTSNAYGASHALNTCSEYMSEKRNIDSRIDWQDPRTTRPSQINVGVRRVYWEVYK